MAITLRHFNVETGEWVLLSNPDPKTRQERPEIYLEESLEDTLLEAFTQENFPHFLLDATFRALVPPYRKAKNLIYNELDGISHG